MNPLDYGPPGRLLARMARMEERIDRLEADLINVEAYLRARRKEEAESHMRFEPVELGGETQIEREWEEGED